MRRVFTLLGDHKRRQYASQKGGAIFWGAEKKEQSAVEAKKWEDFDKKEKREAVAKREENREREIRKKERKEFEGCIFDFLFYMLIFFIM